MAQISVSLPDELDEQVRYYAERNGYATVSDLVRDSLRTTISDQRKLSFWDRALMVRVMEMYGKIMDDDTSEAVEAFRSGYTRDYTNNFQDINPSEMNQDVAEFVYDVFSCYDDLQLAASSFDDDELMREVQFPGYDGNNESEYLGYASYLRKTGRYAYIQPIGRDLNSHCPMLDMYRRMLRKWREIRSKKPHLTERLSKAEIESIVAERIHPSRRPKEK